MRELFDIKQAAKMVLYDMIKFDIPFNKAWSNYNNEWFNNTLYESDKEKTKQLIVDVIDKWF